MNVQPGSAAFQILSFAVVSRSGRPLFIKSFASNAANVHALACREVDAALAAAATTAEGGKSAELTKASINTTDTTISGTDTTDAALHEALRSALAEEDASEAETAQLLLYAALDRMDSLLLTAATNATAAAAAAHATGTPAAGLTVSVPGLANTASASALSAPPLIDSRGLAVFGREMRSRLRVLVLVRHGYAGGVPNASECGRTVRGLMDLLCEATVRAWCDPFRDAAGDEPLASSVVYSRMIHTVFSAYLPPGASAPV
jgi:hypothetical protein